MANPIRFAAASTIGKIVVRSLPFTVTSVARPNGRNISKFTAAAILLGSTAAFAQQTLKVGVAITPWGFADAQSKETVGFAVDVMNAVSKETGVKVEYTVAPSVGDLIAWVLDKKIDVAASSITITPERRAQGLGFTDIYSMNDDALIVSKADTAAYKSIADLKGLTVGTTFGSVYAAGLVNQPGFKELRLYPTADAMYDALMKGEIKVAVNNATGFKYRASHGEFSGLKLAEGWTPAFAAQAAITLRKDDTDTLAKLNAALAKLKANGSLKAFGDKWSVVVAG